jgi:hypothetical protein
MTTLVALAVGVGLLGGIATLIFLSVGSILIWAAFAAWACYFHSGGNGEALKSTIICNVFGVIVAWVAALIILGIPLGSVLSVPLWAGIVVAITVAVYILAAHVKLLSSIPGTTYGYACTFAFLLQTPGKLELAMLTSPTLDNALIVVALSMVIGALFAYASGKLAQKLTTARA